MISLVSGRLVQSGGGNLRLLAGRYIAGGASGVLLDIAEGRFCVATESGLQLLGFWPLSAASFDGVQFSESSGGTPGNTADFWEFNFDNTAVYHGDDSDSEGIIQWPNVLDGATDLEITFEIWPHSEYEIPNYPYTVDGPSTILRLGPWPLQGGGVMPARTVIDAWPSGTECWYQIQIEYAYPDIWVWSDNVLQDHWTISGPLMLASPDPSAHDVLFRLKWLSYYYDNTAQIRNLQIKNAVDGV